MHIVGLFEGTKHRHTGAQFSGCLAHGVKSSIKEKLGMPPVNGGPNAKVSVRSTASAYVCANFDTYAVPPRWHSPVQLDHWPGATPVGVKVDL